MNINILNKKQIFNFYKHFNFFIMKKQILFLVFLVVAVFAGVTNSYGVNELTPSPGTDYTYGVTVTGGLTSPTYLWYVTQAVDVKGGLQETAGGTYFDLVSADMTSTTVELNWKPAAASKTFYLVVYVTGENTASGVTCTAQNMKVYEIKPVNRFVLTATLANSDGSDNTKNQICAPDISTALVTASTPTPTAASVAIKYGTTVLYYKVHAEGMDGNWKPSIQIVASPVFGNSQSVTSVKWADFTGATVNALGAFTGTAVSTVTSATGMVHTGNVPVEVTGTDYLVEITIDNQGFENLLGQTITLGIDGFLPTDYLTVSDVLSLTDATIQTPFQKNAVYTVLPRPTLTETVTSFITKNP